MSYGVAFWRDLQKAEKTTGVGSLFHEGSININKGLYSVKDLGESLTHPYSIAYIDKMQLKKYKQMEKQNKEIRIEILVRCI